MRYKRIAAVLPVGLVLVLGWNLAQVSAAVPGVNEHADLTSGGAIGNSDSRGGSLSHDGRYIAFVSSASNLVANDTNNAKDVFVRDRTSNTITRVSVSSSGTQANSYSQDTPSISDDGRYVVFSSNASNLVSGDTNGSIDVFLHDMQTGTTSLVSSSSSGTEGDSHSQFPQISGDGRFVAFESYATNLVSPSTTHSNVYIKNLGTGTIQLISKTPGGSEGNGDSFSIRLSCDGGVAAFESYASNLVSGDTNAQDDIFVATRAGGDALTNITLGSNNGGEYPSVSCDGMYVAFVSGSSNLVANDTNSQQDIFTYDRRNQTTTLTSLDSSGNQSNGVSLDPTISADGRFVAYDSTATNLISGDTNGYQDVFMRDRLTNTTYAISINSSGQLGNGFSSLYTGSRFSGDSKYLYFTSTATNLISGDTGNVGSGFIAETGL